MKILIAASEVAPIIKLGGLGDVIGSLPKALETLGINADVIVPYYPNAKVQNTPIYKSMEMEVPFNDASHKVEIYKTKLPNSNVDVLLLKNATYFESGGKDAFANKPSETEMFSFFSRSVVEYVKSEFNIYSLIHCNDWHTGLITHILQDELGSERPATLFTIHNLLYQGVGGVNIVREVGIQPGEHRLIDWDMSDGNINFMLQGVMSSDYVNAVSPSYAREIRTLEFGKDMSDLLVAREGRISGILNGLDYTQFPRNYDVHNVFEKKKEYKKSIQEKLKLSKSDKPIFSFISRLDPNQKGLDILIKVIPEIVKNDGQFVLLGNGDKGWESQFEALKNDPSLKDNISINLLFDPDLANEIYAGSDFLLIPSKYEPCGLIQMIAMWYGTLPIVHAVGGLKDSVEDGINGFCFNEYSSGRLFDAITRAFSVYTRDTLKLMIKNAMKTDFSWNTSAKLYKDLYEKVIKLHQEDIQIVND